MSENAQACVRNRSTVVMLLYSEDYVNVLLGIKNDCTLFTSYICLHAVYIMDERRSNHAKAHLPGIQPLKLKTKPHFKEKEDVIKIACKWCFVFPFQPYKMHNILLWNNRRGEMTAGSLLKLVKTRDIQNISLKWLSYMTAESCRRLLNKIFLDSSCEILNTAYTMGRRQGD